jgi:arginine N-succinyltransferase
MPHYPVYVPLLNEAARNAIGQPRPDIEPIMDLLEDEGFEYLFGRCSLGGNGLG